MSKTKKSNFGDIKKVSLEDIPNLGAIQFHCAEWKDDTSRAVLIRYSVHGQKQELGLRLDMDKMVILDSLDEADIELSSELVQERTEEIWSIVARERSNDRAFAHGSHDSVPSPDSVPTLS